MLWSTSYVPVMITVLSMKVQEQQESTDNAESAVKCMNKVVSKERFYILRDIDAYFLSSKDLRLDCTCIKE